MNDPLISSQVYQVHTGDSSLVGTYTFTLNVKFAQSPDDVYATMPNPGSLLFTITITAAAETLLPPASMPADQFYVIGDSELPVTFDAFIHSAGLAISYGYSINPDPSPNLVLNWDDASRTIKF